MSGFRSPEQRAWDGMKTRCYNPNAKTYRFYGKLGITVCDRWRNSCADFIADVGRKPGPKHSLDRYPNKAGNYEPGNVRWATQDQQCNNTKANRIVEFNGFSHTVAEWAKITGLSDGLIIFRLNKGQPPERALVEPARKAIRLHFEGQSGTIVEWAKFFRISKQTLWCRIRNNLSVREILSPVESPTISGWQNP